MKITIIVEGRTEKVFMRPLRAHLAKFLTGKMPNLDALPYNGPIPREDKLKGHVRRLLQGREPSDYVIALTDVHIDGKNPIFKDSEDAKSQMRAWVGDEPRFFPHVAQYDFEAWLLPYWDEILKLAGHNKKEPAKNPESVNHGKPPAYLLNELFRTGSAKRRYVKTRDARRILENQNLSIAIDRCGELKSLVSRILTLCGYSPTSPAPFPHQ